MHSNFQRFTPFVLIVCFCVCLGCDIQSQPVNQVSSTLYIFVVEQYQQFGRPILRNKIVCRFHPSCSVYSINSVRRYGLLHGLYLTYNRITRCRNSVPMGTSDPVPKTL